MTKLNSELMVKSCLYKKHNNQFDKIRIQEVKKRVTHNINNINESRLNELRL